MIQLFSLDTALFKIDGGAMFGVVPKVLWEKKIPADENNQCTWAMRCMLIVAGDRRIVIDTGMGDKQDAKFFSHYSPQGTPNPKAALQKLGYTTDDITDVILTHLHFDHVGGAIVRTENGELKPLFEKAHHWVSERQWHSATNPNPREAASFLKENILPLHERGVLAFWDGQADEMFPYIDMRFMKGHTASMMIPIIHTGKHRVAYVADLFPSTAHLPAYYLPAYDVEPLETMKEKEAFLEEAYAQNFILFFEHDAKYEVCRVVPNPKKAGYTCDVSVSRLADILA